MKAPLLTTKKPTMAHEGILGNRLCGNVGRLKISLDRKDLDDAMAHMFTEVMIANVDVLGAWA